MQFIGAVLWLGSLVVGLSMGVGNGPGLDQLPQENQEPEAVSTQEARPTKENDSNSGPSEREGSGDHGVPSTSEDQEAQVENNTQSITEIVNILFRDDPVTANAVRMAEGGDNPKAMNWNCRYNRPDGSSYSTACRSEDRGRAWSVDCGYFQINVREQECPEILFDPIHNVQVAREMYERRGWQPWAAYNNGSYKKYLP